MDILVGLIMLAVGLTLVFAGLRVVLIALPILGFLAGVSLGVSLMHWAFDENILSTAAGIVVGILIGVVFAVLSYMFWYMAVALGAAAIGASLGTGLMRIFDVDSNTVIVIAAIVGGIIGAALTVMLDLPVYWVIVATAFNGAAWTVAGVMLILNRIDRPDLQYGTIWAAFDESWFWLLAWAIVAAIGVGAQLNMIAQAMLPQERWTRIDETVLRA
jgi:hypothetical protein